MDKWDKFFLTLVVLATLAAAVFFTSQWGQCKAQGGAYVESINGFPKCVEVQK